MEALQVLLAIAFSLLGVVCLILGLLGLPGNWILLALALGMHFLSTGSIGWGFLGAALLIAIAGEALETWASVAGLSAGGSRRRCRAQLSSPHGSPNSVVAGIGVGENHLDGDVNSGGAVST